VFVFPGLGVMIAVLVVSFPYLRDATLGMGQFARIALTAACVVPVGIPMGMAFPWGIAVLRAKAPELIPWAWGMNGLMTVVGSLLSVILSLRLGFDLTLYMATGVYGVAMLSYLALTRSASKRSMACLIPGWSALPHFSGAAARAERRPAH
jgi:hypothetical protein